MKHPSLSRPWAILEDWLRLMAEAEPLANMPASSPPALSQEGVAVIRVEGPLVRREEGGLFALLFGEMCSYEVIAEQFAAALDDSTVGQIVLAVDSPGGDVNGCADLSDLIFKSRGKKPIVACVSGYCASAAYWIASAADRVYCSSTSLLGSIGVRCVLTSTAKRDEMEGVKHLDVVSSQSPFKVTDPDSADDVARVQRQIDDLAQVFVEAVARNRGVTAQDVIKKYGAGDVLVGKLAVNAGLADGIATFDAVIGGTTAGPLASASGGPDMKCAKCQAEVSDDKPMYCEGCVKPEGLVDPEDDEEAKSAKALIASVREIAGASVPAEIIGKLQALRDAAGKVADLTAKIDALEGEKRTAAFDALVVEGTRDGKLSPAMASSPWIAGMRQARDGGVQLRAYLDASPRVLPIEAKEPEGKGSPVALSAEEKAVCEAMGTDPDKYLAAKASK